MFTSATGRLQPVWSFLLSVAFSLAAFVACSFIAALFSGEHILRFEAIFRPLLAAALFGIYFWLLTVADQVEEQRTAALGFPVARGWKRQLGAGCILGLILACLAVIPTIIWADASLDIHVNSHTLLRAAVVLIVLIFGALAEEMMFRGYPFQRLEEVIGPLGAIAVFSVLFALVHLSNPGANPLGLLNTVLIGLVLAIAYLRTRALWLCWGIHFGWNATLGLLFGLPVSGLRIFNVVVRGSTTGSRWLTGGSYGVEASAPGVFAVVIGLLVVWKWPMAQLGKPLTFPRTEGEHLDSVAGIQN
jgi:membrane protease YdiL (CAAX protease family)